MSRKTISSLMAAMLLITAVLMCGCGGGGETSSPSELTYKVTVKDAIGNPCESGTIVKFMSNGTQAAMQLCDANGTAEKLLPAGEYTIELGFTGDASAYYYESITLTTEKYESELLISKNVVGESVVLNVGGEEFDSYAVTAGATYVKLEQGKRSYFRFSPTEAGKYKFSIYGNENAKLGNYGAPHFVQTANIAEMENNTFMIGSGDTGTTTYVIGIDLESSENKSAILCIERIGDPDRTIEDEPWVIYKKTAEISEYDLPKNAVLKEFDLTASTDSYTFVLNEEDGFYHLNTADGPLVLMRLAEDCDYIACFATILDRSGVSRYFYDENGEFVEKVSYSECLLEYIECVDAVEGVYPLTEDLKHIVTQRGEYVGWWDTESNGYLFKDINGNKDFTINTELAWLLMCCYVE